MEKITHPWATKEPVAAVAFGTGGKLLYCTRRKLASRLRSMLKPNSMLKPSVVEALAPCSPVGKLIALTGYIAIASSNPVLAQIKPDGTLGAEGSTVTENIIINGSLADRIDGGTNRGANLFHSFEQFNIGDGQRVYFANPVGIETIFSRVTSSDPSDILGTLGVEGGANLFFLNPNGIIFGENAALDVKGSFVATTANAIQFGSQGFFSASETEVSPLLTVNPSAFFFNQIATRPITSQARLRVPKGRSLLLLGGDVTLNEGRLNAGDGRVELGGLAGSGTVGLNVQGKELSLSFADGVARADVALTNQARVDVNGEGGGFVQVQGDHVTLTDASAIVADTQGNQNGKGILIQASQLSIRDGSQISASTEGQGNSGGVVVNASELVEVIGTGNRSQGGGSGDNERPSRLASESQGAGKADNLIINTRRLVVQDGGRISASTIDTTGGGSLIINASESVEVSGISSQRQRPSSLTVQTRGVGQAGSLTINTGRLSVRDGGEVSASTFGVGGGGDIIINASELVEVSDAAITRDGELPSRIVADTGRPLDTRDVGTIIGTGRGGNLTITTGQLIVQDGAEVSVSGLSLGSERGDAGDLNVTASSMELDNRGAIAATTTSGNGGNIELRVNDVLLLQRKSEISTTAGTGQAGGDGGNILIDAGVIASIPDENSDITANAFSGQGGNVNITTQGLYNFVIRTREEIQALLGTDDLSQFDTSQLPTNDITAISQTSPTLSQIPTLQLQGIDPAQGLVELPSDIVDVARLVEQNLCKASQGSAFIITGRGGLPTPPTEALNADAVWDDWRIVAENQSTESVQSEGVRSDRSNIHRQPTANTPPKAIIEAQGWVKDVNGNIILTAQPTSMTPHGTFFSSVNCQGNTINNQ